MKSLYVVAFALAMLPVAEGAIAPFCTASSAPAVLRAEGLTERTGDILIQCGGAAAGTPIITNLTVFLSASITNRLSAENMVDATLAADTGSGSTIILSRAFLNSSYSLSFNGLTVTPGASGNFSLRISGIRAAASNIPANSPILAYLATSGATQLAMTSNTVTVGIPQPSLLTSQGSSLVNCYGSPVPSPLTLSNLFTGTAHATTRVTEALPNALEKRDPTSMDTGVRVILRFSGFPAAARIFVPNVVAGSTATVPTTGKGLGSDPGVGRYTPTTSGSLLLARVTGADAAGAGGTMPYAAGPVGSGTALLDSAGEAALTDGAGYVVFEVLDANPGVLENAQIPVFLGLPQITDGNVDYKPEVTVSYAPVSKQMTAMEGAPVPRFTASTPGSDCEALGDCNANFRSKLQVNTEPIKATAMAGSLFEIRWLSIVNATFPNSEMPWTATIRYENGNNWIRMDPLSASNMLTARVDLMAEKLIAGTYKATILIDASGAGQKTVPVELQVTSAIPTLSGYGNAANGKGPLVAGSLALLTGTMLNGEALSVTFDGVPAEVVSNAATELRVVVPAAVSGKSSAQVVASVNGVSSQAMTVNLAAVAPVVFPLGVLNEDGSVNTEQNPVPPGGLLLVRVSGLPETGITARIGDRDILAPPYTGPAPGLPGVQQVNVPVPSDFGGGATVILCAPDPATGEKVCTEPALLYVTLP